MGRGSYLSVVVVISIMAGQVRTNIEHCLVYKDIAHGVNGMIMSHPNNARLVVILGWTCSFNSKLTHSLSLSHTHTHTYTHTHTHTSDLILLFLQLASKRKSYQELKI